MYWTLSPRRDEIAAPSLWTCYATGFMRSSRSGLLPEKPKELLPLPPRQRLQQRPHQSLDLYLTVFFGVPPRAFSRAFCSLLKPEVLMVMHDDRISRVGAWAK